MKKLIQKKCFLFGISLFCCANMFSQWNNTGNSKTTGNLTIGSNVNNSYSELRILGPNLPTTEDSKRDVVFDFSSAGKSIIRAYRTGGWANSLDFITTDETGALRKRLHIGNYDETIYSYDHFSVGGTPGDTYIAGEMGTRLYFRGTYSNGDIPSIYRYNRAPWETDLRVDLGDGANDRLAIGYTSWDNGNLTWAQAITLHSSGKMGIGVVNPQNALDVKGTICADRVEVKPVTWSDFVFAKSYNLPSLQSVEQHIEEHQHLPGIPSEKEVMENGIDVAQIQAKLLQKVEELTLYTIQQQKLIETLQHEVEMLKSNK